MEMLIQILIAGLYYKVYIIIGFSLTAWGLGDFCVVRNGRMFLSKRKNGIRLFDFIAGFG